MDAEGAIDVQGGRRHGEFGLHRVLPMLALALGGASVAMGQLRVGTWNIAQLRGHGGSMTDVLAEASLDGTPGFVVPVGIWVFQEVDVENVDILHDLLGSSWSQGTYTSSGEDNYGGAQAMFYHSSIFTEVVSGHDDIYTGAGRRTDRWQLRMLGTSDPPVDLYIYSSHLKASPGSKNQAERLFGVEQILENAATLPAGSKIIYAGDYNFYSSGESGYEALVAPGDVAGIDPYGNGSWGGASNAIKHTQSPRASSAGGLVGGGLDDRFDMHLHTLGLADGMGVEYIPGTHRSLGNDGNHYDDSINDGSNSYFPGDGARSDALADDLHEASDHLPVLADYTEPAVLGASMSPAFDTVIVGGVITLTLTVDNLAMVEVPWAGADLHWTATGSGLLSGASESGIVAPDDGPSVLQVDVTTVNVGSGTGSLLMGSPHADTQGTGAALVASGTVLKHSNASFADDHDSNFNVESFSFQADTGLHEIDVQLYNYQWDELQARLDLDAMEEPALPLTYMGLPVQGIAGDPVTLPFLIDTDGLAPGTVVENLDVHVSDEDLPGGIEEILTLVFSIEIEDAEQECPGDFSGDGMTNVSDLLLVISSWGNPYDVSDLLAVISDWDCSQGP